MVGKPMTDQDRIRLAEAMGWVRIDEGGLWENSKGFGRELEQNLPDPFTDANDDYAVLEWMRNQKNNAGYWGLLEGVGRWQYQIGDYARAALKVLDGR